MKLLFFLLSMLVLTPVYSARVGDLFNTNIINNPGYNYYAANVAVNEFGQTIVAHAYEYPALISGTAKAVQVVRYKSDGSIDTNFANNGVWTNLTAPSDTSLENVRIALTTDGSIIVGYNIDQCVAQNSCQTDIQLFYISDSGLQLDDFLVSFNRSNNILTQDDRLEDIFFEASQNLVVIAATVETDGVSGLENTDFGLAVLDLDISTNSLSYSTFGGDGRRECGPNQLQGAGRDNAAAVVWNPVDLSFIVGGTASEGNGANSDGTNLAFCEFQLSTGDILQQWSTINLPNRTDDREIMGDMALRFVQNEPLSIIIAGAVAVGNPNSSLEMAVLRYEKVGFNWVPDTDFGGDYSAEIGPGWGTVGFQVTLNGIDFLDTDDVAQGMAIGTDGTILVAGYSELDDPINGEKSLAVTQFTRYGKNHGTWAGNGKAIYNYAPQNRDAGFSVVRDQLREKSYIGGVLDNGMDQQTLMTTLRDDIQFFGTGFE